MKKAKKIKNSKKQIKKLKNKSLLPLFQNIIIGRKRKGGWANKKKKKKVSVRFFYLHKYTSILEAF